MITLIHGPAELLRSEALARIRSKIADDPALAELNTTVLDGRQVDLADLRFACETLPFLADRRLVVIEGLLKRLATPVKPRGKVQPAAEVPPPPAQEESDSETTAGRSSQAITQPTPKLQNAILAYLADIPASTELVLVEDDTVSSGTVLRRILDLQREGGANVIACSKPKRSDLPEWIRARAKMRKVQLDAAALADLAEFVGDDLRQLDQELIKLSDFATGRSQGRAGYTIARADVRQLVPATRAANVFDLVEALGAGNTGTAARLLRQALDADGEQPLRLLALISRQYRLIIQAKAMQGHEMRQPEMAHELGVPDWTVPKLLSQAARHSFRDLEHAMGCILAADEAIKTGKFADREAMDVLLGELTILGTNR